jgi:uncharacterized protein (DUF433 family)
VFDALAQAPRNTVSLEGGLIKIDVREPRRALAASHTRLRRARRLVVTDPEILGGDPAFRGTRVPVHMIAELAAQGSMPAELIEGYPRLTAEMIRLAPVYAAAYPLRGLGAISSLCAVHAGSPTPSRCREVSDRRMPQRRPGSLSPGNAAMKPSTSHVGRAGWKDLEIRRHVLARDLDGSAESGSAAAMDDLT